MIRVYVVTVVTVASVISIASLLRETPRALLILFPLPAGTFCLLLSGAFLWSALTVPTDRLPGVLAALALGLLAALNLGAVFRAIIRRR